MQGKRLTFVKQGKRLLLDKNSGFLTTADGGVTAQQKIDFLNALEKTGNVNEACKLSNLNGLSVRHHRQIDQSFAKAYNNIIQDLCDKVVGCLYYAATHSKNVTAMFGFLRAYRGEEFGDKRVVEHKETKTERIKTLLNKFKKEGKLIDLPVEK